MKINLHMHTSESDGVLTPQEIMEQVRNEGILMYSVTDHDNIKAQEYLLENESDLTYIKGVELTALFNNDEVHILGYDFDLDMMKKYTEEYLYEKEQRAIRLYLAVRNLIDGFSIDIKKYSTFSRGRVIDELILQGFATNRADALKRYINQFPEHITVPPNVEDIIKVIKNAGGIAILAHPYDVIRAGLKIRLHDNEVTQIIDHTISCGVDGLEVYYKDYDESQVGYLSKICKTNKLLSSLGTDYHGRKDQSLYYKNKNITLEDVTIVNQIDSTNYLITLEYIKSHKEINNFKLKIPKLICIEGISGSGKTTQILEVEKKLKLDGHKVKSLNVPINNYYGVILKGLYNKTYDTTFRAKLNEFAGLNTDQVALNLYQALYEAMLEEVDIVIMARGILSTYTLYVEHFINKYGKERGEYKFSNLLRNFPKPSFIVYLSLSAEEARNRIESRNREDMSRKLDQFDTLYKTHLLNINALESKFKAIPHSIIDASNSIDSISEEILSKIKSTLK